MATLETPKIASDSARHSWISAEAWQQVREYAPTFVTEFAVMVSQVVVYKLAAFFLGKEGFSEYALARRTVTLILPVTVLGLSVGLPRYIAYSKGQNDLEPADRYYGAALLLVSCAAFLCVLLMNVFAKVFGYLFFGDQSYGFMAFPLSLMLVGLCMHTVACSYYRGHMQLNRANFMQFLNLACAPLLVFFLLGHSVSGVLSGLGLAWTMVAGVGLLVTPWRSAFGNNFAAMKEILRYGIQRVPGDFIFMGLFVLPPTITAHVSGVQQAGFVAFGITVLSTVGALFTPLGLVLLPKATFMFAEGARAKLRQHVWLIVKGTFVASLLAALTVWIWIPNFIHLYLGHDFDQIVIIVRVLIIGALPLSLYLVLRILVDAYHEYAVTGAILFCGLSSLLLGIIFGRRLGSGPNSVLISLVLALYVLAVLSSLECNRILSKRGARN